MSDGSDRLPEEAARRVWKRAADLQAQASEAPPRLPAPPGSEPRAGYDLEHVRAAAAAVGIAPELVAQALAEEHGPDPDPDDRAERWAGRLLGPGSRALGATRSFACSVEELGAAVRSVFARHHLTLLDQDLPPRAGGRMTFAVPASGAGSPDFVVSGLTGRSRVETLQLRVLPLEAGRCLASLSAPLGTTRRAHLGLGAALSAGGVAGGGWAMGALAAAVVVPLGIGAGAAAAAIGGALLLGGGAGGALGVARARAIHRSGRDQATEALERLLQMVEVELGGG